MVSQKYYETQIFHNIVEQYKHHNAVPNKLRPIKYKQT